MSTFIVIYVVTGFAITMAMFLLSAYRALRLNRERRLSAIKGLFSAHYHTRAFLIARKR